MPKPPRQSLCRALHPYVPLWVKSHFSFLEGASSPEDLVERAALYGLPALALCDRGGIYGVVRAFERARSYAMPLIVGAEITLRFRQTRSPLLLLARSGQGYSHLCRLLSLGHREGGKKECIVDLEALLPMAAGLLVLCPEPALFPALRLAWSEDLYALCARHRALGEAAAEGRLRAAAKRHGLACVAAVEVLYHRPEQQALHDVLSCIRLGKTLTTVGRGIRSNAGHALPSPQEMRALFADDLSSVLRSIEVAERCSFRLSELRYRYPEEALPDGHDEGSWLRSLTFRGAQERYPKGLPDKVRRQLEHELQIIEALEYGGYFLTMHEIVMFCRSQGILCQGRGSAANSALCYCLGITALDPVKHNLLFERFLSRERAEPPDIDLDIEHERREEVIQHLYARYGRSHAAMVANVVRYRPRSALRDVGKALDLPLEHVDRAARLMSHFDSALPDDLLQSAGLDPQLPLHRHYLHLAKALLNTPRHLSIHPGGFLLGHHPVDQLVPIEPATMPGRTVIQWDKNDIETLGLFKVDLLGLGALSMIRRAFSLLQAQEGLAYEIATVPAEDPETYAMISRGDTVGVFQIESRAQMAMLPRLKPQTLYDLVIEVAIVRPGPIQGDMVHPYLQRRAGLEPVVYPHPRLEAVLSRTLGVPIFQEQVMQLAVEVAGYSPGEADQLRRDMAAWKSRGRLEEHREDMIRRMVENGVAQEFAERIFSQIEGFGEYGFPESHAASFALLAYVTAWLRCHHPAVFTCSMLNSQPMGFYSPSTLIEDAKRRGIELRPVDVLHSTWDCSLESLGHPRSHALRLGFSLLKSLSKASVEALPPPPRHWPSVEAFVHATSFSPQALLHLAQAGAFESLGCEVREALWRVRAALGDRGLHLPLPQDEGAPRFPDATKAERILWDYGSGAHSTRGHPMEVLRARLPSHLPKASEVAMLEDRQGLEYVGMVICRQRPQTASGVMFLTLEDESGFVNVVVWKQVAERFSICLKSARLLGVRGHIQKAEGVVHLVAERLWKLALGYEATLRSRDFH